MGDEDNLAIPDDDFDLRTGLVEAKLSTHSRGNGDRAILRLHRREGHMTFHSAMIPRLMESDRRFTYTASPEEKGAARVGLPCNGGVS